MSNENLSWDPSPPPPLILIAKQQQLESQLNECDYNSSLNIDDDFEYLSDISCGNDSNNGIINGSNNNNNTNNMDTYTNFDDIDSETMERIRRGSVSPDPPWGRSPSPPIYIFNKKKRKKSRWDDRDKHGSNGLSNNINASNIIRNNKHASNILPLRLDTIDINGNNIDINSITINNSKIISDDIGVSNDINTNSDNELFDARINTKNAERQTRPKAFKFIKQGTYIDKALALRQKALTKDLKYNRNKKDKIDIKNAAKPDPNQFENGLDWLDDIPSVEWWDKILLNDIKFDKNIKIHYHNEYKYELITDLIENPKILRPELLSNETEPYVQAWYLTKKEKQKIRRMERKQKNNEIQDHIRLGLIPAPEPRLKLSNIMRVLGNSAIIDPSAAEFKAKAQMEKRRIKHLLHNAKRKLDPTQKRIKKRKKLEEDTSREVYINLFKIGRLNKKNKFKCQINAQQYNLTGCILILKNEDIMSTINGNDNNNEDNNGFTMILVEGGQKGVRFYNNLVMNRIKWNQSNNDNNIINGNSNNKLNNIINGDNDNNYCHCIWEGIVAKRNFQAFLIKSCENKAELRKFLSLRKCAHYMDMVVNQTIL